jgi:hypothetical protein
MITAFVFIKECAITSQLLIREPNSVVSRSAGMRAPSDLIGDGFLSRLPPWGVRNFYARNDIQMKKVRTALRAVSAPF